jgi:hypothetical protein
MTNKFASILARGFPMEWNDDDPMPREVSNKYHWMKLVIKYTKRDPYLRCVAFVLQDHADKAGCAWPSLNRISDEAGLVKNTAISRIEKLTTDGFLVQSKSRYERPTWRHNVYQLTVPLSLLSEYRNLERMRAG